jgi:hypothetical protein
MLPPDSAGVAALEIESYTIESSELHHSFSGMFSATPWFQIESAASGGAGGQREAGSNPFSPERS